MMLSALAGYIQSVTADQIHALTQEQQQELDNALKSMIDKLSTPGGG